MGKKFSKRVFSVDDSKLFKTHQATWQCSLTNDYFCGGEKYLESVQKLFCRHLAIHDHRFDICFGFDFFPLNHVES